MFVHLRLHTEYSVVDGTTRVDDVAKRAAADGQPALAVTDLNNMFGAVKLYRAARANGVKPVLGTEITVTGPWGEGYSNVILLVQNHTGYLHISELLARAWIDDIDKAQARVTWEDLAARAEGLIVLSGAQAGPVGQALLRDDLQGAATIARRFAKAFPDRFYIELQRAGRADDESYIHAAVPLAAQLKLPVVATHPIQFPEPDDYEAHEARVCIAEGTILGDRRRVRRFTPEQYFKTTAQMEALFADLPSAIANTVEIAKRCSITLTLGHPQLPHFPIPEGFTMEEYFRHMTREGFEERLKHLYPDEAEREKQRPHYEERLEFELDIILKMDFPGYFLIVADFINWAKTHGCPVGPGRGSGASSLVAYALKITDLDPLRYNLLFERFLNPERVSMPDFDVDFCQANRDRVIDYVKSRYGKDAVSQIATFGTMAARAAIRDVGRVLDMSYSFCDGISKLIPNKPGKPVSLQYPPDNLAEADKEKYAIAAEPELAARIQNEEEVRLLVEMAQKLEGITRNIGMHAGGVVIAPGKLTDFGPLYQQPGSGSAVTQYDKGDVEDTGLVKFDFLGLATLTILELAKEFIVARHADRKGFNFDDIPLDDKATFKLFQEGRTEAVFQFESRGMQGMLRDAMPTRFEDLVALNAMYRPGPMENIPSFVARKRGREEVVYPHPLLKPVLEETYGIMVYQEQVMQAAQILAGYSLGGADLLRRAMGKKKLKEMVKHRGIFREGAAKKGIDGAKADEIFDLMEKFAGYGFNKSHAVAYSLLAYYTGWLKVHYAPEFYAANMTIEMGNTDKLKVLYEDAQREGLHMELPDVNAGVFRFEPDGEKGIRYGLGAVKGTGQLAIDAIVAAREAPEDGSAAGPFTSLFDFCCRADRTRVNKRTVEALIRAGAFDATHHQRSDLIASLDLAFEYAATREANRNQGGLFDAVDDGYASMEQEPALVATPEWSLRERLHHEKDAIGFFISGHLFDAAAPEVRRFAPRLLSDLQASSSRDTVVVAGIVSDFRIINGHRGRVALFKLDDKSGVLDARVEDPLLARITPWLKNDELLIVSARVFPDRFSGGIQLSISDAWDLAGARCRFGKYLQVVLGTQRPAELGAAIGAFPAHVEETEDGPLTRGLPIRLALERREGGAGAAAEVELTGDARCYPCDAALARWAQEAQGQGVAVVYG